jgi:hypothetical protein
MTPHLPITPSQIAENAIGAAGAEAGVRLRAVGDGGYLVLFIFIVLIVAALISRSRNKDTGAIAVDASPTQAVDEAVSYMVTQGLILSHKADTSATFSRPQRPKTEIGCLLLLLGIVPGVLYFALIRGTRHTSVIATSGPAGTQMVISGDDPTARGSFHRWAREVLGVEEASASLGQPEREPCWKCGSRTTPADVRCPSCGAWLRPQSAEHPFHALG